MRLLTPPGSGGVAVVVLEGPDAPALARRILRRGGRPLPLGPPGTRAPRPPALAELVVDGERLDRVLVVERSDRIELHVHAAPLVVARLEEALGLEVAPVGPVDRLLREARSDGQLALALEQREHDLGRFLAGLARLPAPRRRAELALALERSRVARALAGTCRVVLCGAQNAGKSTLFNRLLMRERALVGARAGLTRDPVTEITCLDGYPFELVDTAGLGPAASDLDAWAQARGRRRRDGALRLLVVDGSRGPGPEDHDLVGGETLVICNKADLPAAPWGAPFAPDLRISAVDGARASSLRRVIGRLLRRLRRLPRAGPVGGPAALDAAQEATLRAAVEGDRRG